MVELSILAWIQMESRPKTVEQVRISHVEIPTFPEQLYKCNFLAFMLVSHSVRYIPGWYVSRHNHSTMKNQRWTEMCCVWSKAWRSIWSVFLLVFVCECVPRLPLLPMLGSLASAIQLYSGGMETGLWSPGMTNQQSESPRKGGGVWCCRRKVERHRGRHWDGGQEEDERTCVCGSVGQETLSGLR